MKRLLICLCLLCLPLVASAMPPIPPLPPPVPTNVQVRLPVVTARMHQYSQTGDALYFVGTAYGLLLISAILYFRLSARMRDVAVRFWHFSRPVFWWPSRLARRRLSPKSRRRFVLVWYGPKCFYQRSPLLYRHFVEVMTFYVLYSAVMLCFSAPLIFYSGFWLSHAYGLSHQSFSAWLIDVAEDHLLSIAGRAGCFWLLFGLIRWSPRRWIIWTWALLIPLIAFGIFTGPLVIDPLFNKFTPLPAGQLRTQIESLAAKAGIPDAPILVADKSKQTDETNAYVTGIGSSARIVLWDTLLKGKNQMPDDQILAIVGHEMGHYVLKHLYLGFAEAVGGLLVALPLLQVCVQWLMRRFGPRWGVTGLTDPAAIPVFLLVFFLMTFLADPITSALSRRIEHAADAYGLAVTQNRVAMAQAFVSLSEQNLSDPYPPPFIKFWLSDHPPLGERIEFALGRPLPRP
jgi:STE24 endopeptidase